MSKLPDMHTYFILSEVMRLKDAKIACVGFDEGRKASKSI